MFIFNSRRAVLCPRNQILRKINESSFCIIKQFARRKNEFSDIKEKEKVSKVKPSSANKLYSFIIKPYLVAPCKNRAVILWLINNY